MWDDFVEDEHSWLKNVIPRRRAGDQDVKIWLSIVVGSLLTLAVLWCTSLPLGIPGEWTWDRAATEPDSIWNLASGLVIGALLIGFVIRGRQRFDVFAETKSFRLEPIAWLAGLVVVGFAWLWLVQEISPLKNRIGKSAFVLYYPSSSGYFTRARYDDPHAGELLARYEDLMREGDVLHTGTHPPGLFLVFHGLFTLCESSSTLSAFLDATQPGSFQEACDVIYTNSQRGHKPRILLPLDRRALWLATLIVIFLAALTVVPLYGLMRRSISAPNAWTCAALWPAVPALAAFIPKSDAAFPCLGLMLLWVWLTAWERRSLLLSFLAGLLTWCCLLCSLAFLPMLLAAFCLTLGASLWRIAFPEKSRIAADSTSLAEPLLSLRHGACILAAFIGGAIPTATLGAISRINMLTIWWWNYQNHAGFYRQYPRTYWKWLLVNPLELAVAAGWPIALFAILASVHGWRSAFVLQGKQWGTQTIKAVVSLTLVWGILWITGKNSGEAARLWLLFIPWLIWLASFEIESAMSKQDDPDVRQRLSLQILAIQFLVCLLTVTRISGFHMDSN